MFWTIIFGVLLGCAGVVGTALVVLKASNGLSAPLQAGICECGHVHCSHRDGTGKCAVAMEIAIAQGITLLPCACQIFIPAAGPVDSKAIAKELGVKL